MKFFSYIKVLFIITTVVFIIPSISFADADKIFRENNKAVVVVVVYDREGNAIGQGSGFIIRADSHAFERIQETG